MATANGNRLWSYAFTKLESLLIAATRLPTAALSGKTATATTIGSLLPASECVGIAPLATASRSSIPGSERLRGDALSFLEGVIALTTHRSDATSRNAGTLTTNHTVAVAPLITANGDRRWSYAFSKLENLLAFAAKLAAAAPSGKTYTTTAIGSLLPELVVIGIAIMATASGCSILGSERRIGNTCSVLEDVIRCQAQFGLYTTLLSGTASRNAGGATTTNHTVAVTWLATPNGDRLRNYASSIPNHVSLFALAAKLTFSNPANAGTTSLTTQWVGWHVIGIAFHAAGDTLRTRSRIITAQVLGNSRGGYAQDANAKDCHAKLHDVRGGCFLVNLEACEDGRVWLLLKIARRRKVHGILLIAN